MGVGQRSLKFPPPLQIIACLKFPPPLQIIACLHPTLKLKLFSLSYQGLYQNSRNGVAYGACAPLLIHTDKSKTKEKEKEERDRQRSGEEITASSTAPRFLVGLDDLPDIRVETTMSGSMTQEVFFSFAQHFISSLPSDHGAVILFLDGHGSRWSVPALRYLMRNQVYPFFLASHTSIWSQPNDGGVNKRFHHAIEESCSSIRREHEKVAIPYFNSNFKQGWQNFLNAEWLDLHKTGMNNATNAFKRTGLYPYDPNCESWSHAIETLGLGNDDNKGKVQYEIYPLLPPKQLSIEEKEILRQDVYIDPENDKDLVVAFTRAEQILKKWREDIEKAVSEEEQYEEYANILVP